MQSISPRPSLLSSLRTVSIPVANTAPTTSPPLAPAHGLSHSHPNSISHRSKHSPSLPPSAQPTPSSHPAHQTTLSEKRKRQKSHKREGSLPDETLPSYAEQKANSAPSTTTTSTASTRPTARPRPEAIGNYEMKRKYGTAPYRSSHSALADSVPRVPLTSTNSNPLSDTLPRSTRPASPSYSHLPKRPPSPRDLIPSSDKAKELNTRLSLPLLSLPGNSPPIRSASPRGVVSAPSEKF